MKKSFFVKIILWSCLIIPNAYAEDVFKGIKVEDLRFAVRQSFFSCNTKRITGNPFLFDLCKGFRFVNIFGKGADCSHISLNDRQRRYCTIFHSKKNVPSRADLREFCGEEWEMASPLCQSLVKGFFASSCEEVKSRPLAWDLCTLFSLKERPLVEGCSMDMGEKLEGVEEIRAVVEKPSQRAAHVEKIRREIKNRILFYHEGLEDIISKIVEIIEELKIDLIKKVGTTHRFKIPGSSRIYTLKIVRDGPLGRRTQLLLKLDFLDGAGHIFRDDLWIDYNSGKIYRDELIDSRYLEKYEEAQKLLWSKEISESKALGYGILPLRTHKVESSAGYREDHMLTPFYESKVGENIFYKDTKALPIKTDFIRGLYKLHKKGLIHRNISSSTVVIENQLTRQTALSGNTLLTDKFPVGELDGSVGFIPPEAFINFILSGGKKSYNSFEEGKMGDVYATGMVFLKLLKPISEDITFKYFFELSRGFFSLTREAQLDGRRESFERLQQQMDKIKEWHAHLSEKYKGHNIIKKALKMVHPVADSRENHLESFYDMGSS